MKQIKIIFIVLCFLFIVGSAVQSSDPKKASAASIVGEKTLVLYDANSGSIPEALMGFTEFPSGSAMPLYTDGMTVLDTTVSGSETYAGWIPNTMSAGFPILDRTAGFQLNFRVQVEAESHNNNHRAGFSVILLSKDAKGIELAFWQNEVWAQGDASTGGLFRHAEGVAFDTTSSPTDYRLTILDETYALTANNQPILTGPVRDYSAFEGFPDPYQIPHFLFLGDDTTSAQARIHLGFVSITGTESETPTATGSPVSTVSPAPTPSITPLSSPTPPPAGKAFELCPSGLIFLSIVTVIVVAAKVGRRNTD